MLTAPATPLLGVPGTPGSPLKGAGGADGATSGKALLEVPALRLVAPVLQGTSDSVLGEAVGHDPASAWQGSPGTSVLSAHDVAWFSSIGKLKAGDVVRYVTPCRTYTYHVTKHDLVSAGSPVYTTSAERIVLSTCYPFNALYLTPNRYLVYADLTSAGPTHPPAAPPPVTAPPRVPAPPALAAQGLGLGPTTLRWGTSCSPGRRQLPGGRASARCTMRPPRSPPTSAYPQR